MVLFINACVRKNSRTRKLAEALLSGIKDEVCEVKVADIAFPVANEDFLKKRDSLIAKGEWDDPLFDLARQFASAESIIVAAPYWDLSFPACLKQYFEQINVLGITFEYSAEGLPVPKCNADKLYYVTTAGGAFVPEEFGFGYIKALAQGFYGIDDVRLIKATGLDIDGADVDEIMGKAIDSVQ
ncbi:MAG: NAD(P)H-dependent oxidoreductase [Lachnospiraceae bacterium]|nr:NAD(P)H-dependent oxidoreductase [Lachnospiraceae bacterium]